MLKMVIVICIICFDRYICKIYLEIAEVIVNMTKQQKRKTETRLGGSAGENKKLKRTGKEWIEKGMLNINFDHVRSIYASCEEFVWGRALMVTKVEDLPTWTKNPPFPPPQPLDSQTTKSPHLAIHKHP